MWGKYIQSWIESEWVVSKHCTNYLGNYDSLANYVRKMPHWCLYPAVIQNTSRITEFDS